METSVSLLQRLRDEADASGWEELIRVYQPLIARWIRRYTGSTRDADDVAQEVFSVVVRKVKDFERQRTGSFRTWLRLITVNCLRDAWRAKKFSPAAPGGSTFDEALGQLEDPRSGLSRVWDEEYHQHTLKNLLDRIREDVPEPTWAAFFQVAVEGKPVAVVAEQLGVTPNVVYIARSRVMTRLRQLGEGLLED